VSQASKHTLFLVNSAQMALLRIGTRTIEYSVSSYMLLEIFEILKYGNLKYIFGLLDVK
jgi:hypothetical protein